MLAHLHPIADQRGRNPKYVCYYELFEKEINIDGIEYPVKLADINQLRVKTRAFWYQCLSWPTTIII